MTDLAAIQITGKDAGSFLQRQASNDISKINPEQGVYISFLSPQGKIKALGYLIKKSGEEFWLLTHASKIEDAKNHLEKFVITEDVVISSSRGAEGDVVIQRCAEMDCHVASLLAMTERDNIYIEDFSEEDTLIKLDLIEKYVCFTKGCFPGQEVLSKYKNIGLRKREERATQYLEEALGIFAHAKESNQEEEYTKAISLLKQALKENPKNEDAYETLGVILAKQGKIQEAIMVMHQLEMINPQSIMAQTNLSIFYMKLGDKETAEEHKAKGTLLQFDQALKK